MKKVLCVLVIAALVAQNIARPADPDPKAAATTVAPTTPAVKPDAAPKEIPKQLADDSQKEAEKAVGAVPHVKPPAPVKPTHFLKPVAAVAKAIIKPMEAMEETMLKFFEDF